MNLGYFVLFSFVLSVTTNALAETDGSRQKYALDDPTAELCGPRAVLRILAWYGIEEELHALTGEILPVNRVSDSSMSKLQSALKKRGIATTPFKIGPSIRINPSSPVLIHLIGRNDYRHFAVLLPKEGPMLPEEAICPTCADFGRNRVWLGPGDIQCLSDEEIGNIRSGAVLATGLNKAEEADTLFSRIPLTIESVSAEFIVVALIPITLVTVFFTLFKYERKCKV